MGNCRRRGPAVCLLLWFLAGFELCAALNHEGLALLRFREMVEDDPCGALVGWDAGDASPCSWFGVECSDDGRVIGLSLANLGLKGMLSPEIGQLTSMHSLILHKNFFYGIIPTEIGDLLELKVLDLGYNNFNGPIPSELIKLLSRDFIFLQGNRLNGPLELNELVSLCESRVHQDRTFSNRISTARSNEIRYLTVPTVHALANISAPSTVHTGPRSDGPPLLLPLTRRLLRPARRLAVQVVPVCDSLRLAKLVINSCNVRGRGHQCCDAIIAVIGRGQICFCAVSQEGYYRQSVPKGGRDMMVFFRQCTGGMEPTVQDKCDTDQSSSQSPHSTTSAPVLAPPVAAPSTAPAPSSAATASPHNCLDTVNIDWFSRTLAIIFAVSFCFCCMYLLWKKVCRTHGGCSVVSPSPTANVKAVELTADCNFQYPPQPHTALDGGPVDTHVDENSGDDISREPLIHPNSLASRRKKRHAAVATRRSTRFKRAVSRWLFDEGVKS